jgi:hypothetical protein
MPQPVVGVLHTSQWRLIAISTDSNGINAGGSYQESRFGILISKRSQHDVAKVAFLIYDLFPGLDVG